MVVLLVAAGVLVMRQTRLHGGNQSQQPAASPAGEHSQTKTAVALAATNVAPLRVVGVTNAPGAVQKGRGAQPEVRTADQQTAEKMRERLEQEDQKGALQLARQLVEAKDAEVRSEVVGVLGWIGVKALPELSKMLGDRDPAVAQDAFEQWKTGVDEIQDDAAKGQVLVAGMLAMKDQTELESSVMEFNDLPDPVAVRSLVTIIQSQNVAASEVAREHYEFVTGEPFTNVEASESWIKNNTEPVTP